MAMIPAATTVEVGDHVQFSPNIGGGALCSPWTTTFTSVDPSIATIDASGFATGVAVGVASIRLQVRANDGLTRTTGGTLTVVPPTVATVTVTPGSATAPIGGILPFTASASSAAGLPVTGQSFAWNSTNPATASVDVNGRASALAPGVATIQAIANGKVGSATLTVIDPASCQSPVTIFEDFESGDPFAATILPTGGSTGTSARQVSGGNPGGYRRMSHVLPSPSSIAVIHLHPTTYNPQSLGAITRLEYSEDRIQLNPPFQGAAIGAAFVLSQGGNTYALPLTGGVFTSQSWERTTRLDLRATDFPGVNFSSTGAPIQFGFMRSNSADPGGAQHTTTHGIDNWSLRICR